MLIGRNKLKKHNPFDVLDADLLENYLSEMALKGWMISDISISIDDFDINNYIDLVKEKLII